MSYRIEVFNKPDFTDVHGQEVLATIKQLGIRTVEAAQAIRVFLIEGKIDSEQLQRIAREYWLIR